MRKAPMQFAVDEAVRRVGSKGRVAKRLGISRQAVDQWEKVPAERVLALESISGVSRYQLRPDIYGPGPSEAEQCAA